VHILLKSNGGGEYLDTFAISIPTDFKYFENKKRVEPGPLHFHKEPVDLMKIH
jgi:hypothetical protein